MISWTLFIVVPRLAVGADRVHMHTRTGARDCRELSAHDVCNKSRLSSHTNTLSIYQNFAAVGRGRRSRSREKHHHTNEGDE